MSDSPRLAAVSPWVDNVAAWNNLREQYPEAIYTTDWAWFYGALRDADDVLRARDLNALILRLLAREHHPEDTPGV